MPIHLRRISVQPTIRIEDCWIRTKDVLVVLHHSRIDTHTASLRKESSCNHLATSRDMTGETEADAGVQSHAFLAARCKVWEFNSLCIFDLGCAELARVGSRVDLRGELVVGSAIFQEMVENGADCNGGGVTTREAIQMRRKRESQQLTSSGAGLGFCPDE